MPFLLDLRQAIKLNQPIAPLLDGCIRPPRQNQNPLVSWARALFGDEKLKAYIVEAVQENLHQAIKDNQEALRLLNTKEGREYLHKNLDSLLDYLTGAKFSGSFFCPKCKAPVQSKACACPGCGVALKWK